MKEHKKLVEKHSFPISARLEAAAESLEARAGQKVPKWHEFVPCYR